ncbi:MAG: bifunctional lysine ketoglutarate reductase /saccharopine dehydrogenase family protein [Thermoanaerobaculia bacterium]|nr:bifunctional lysine ketoglutarate reductase /saccharopine dehydrogenase family protein [Thermoanaerobaculia bacterium]
MTRSIGIRREDKSAWERRAPLVPADVAELVAAGYEVLVQPSDIRVFSDDEYREAGASVDEDLSSAGVILAVKEVPIPLLVPERTYLFFAHVIKGQEHNMPLLRRMLDLGITLVDYERIADADGRRLVKFGRQAGQAGMVETLHALGHRLAAEGIETPLADVRQPFHYGSLEAVRQALSQVASTIETGFRPPSDGPLVFAFTGRGSVTQGAWEVFERLPYELIAPEDLPRRLADHDGLQRSLLAVRLEKRHLATPKDPDKEFEEAEYRAHPERYRGRLHRLLPYFTALVNGIYWDEDFPRFVTRRAMREMWRRGDRKLRVIGDISCDIEGSVELTHEATQPDAPCYVYDPESDSFHAGLDGPGVAIMAVDNLPCELPIDASREFSVPLRGFVPALADADWSVPYGALSLPSALRRAVITHRGELTPDYHYLERHLELAGLGRVAT